MSLVPAPELESGCMWWTPLPAVMGKDLVSISLLLLHGEIPSCCRLGGGQHGIFCHTCSLMRQGDKVLKCTVSTHPEHIGATSTAWTPQYHACGYHATFPNTCCTISHSTTLLWSFLALSQGVIPDFSLFNRASWTVKVKLYWEYFCSKVIG